MLLGMKTYKLESLNQDLIHISDVIASYISASSPSQVPSEWDLVKNEMMNIFLIKQV